MKSFQHVENGVVINNIVVDDAVSISQNARNLLRDDAIFYSVDENSVFMEVEGAAIGWVIHDGTLAPPVVNEPAATKQELKDYASLVRKEIEVGGIVIADMTVATDYISQSKILGAYVAASRNPEWSTMWESSVLINAQTMSSIGDAVQAHINATFVKRGDIWADIEVGTITTKEQVLAAFNE